MKVDSVKNQIFTNETLPNSVLKEGSVENSRYISNKVQDKYTPSGVSFKAGPASERSWAIFRNLSDYMKEPSELVSAIIQAIGTSIVAPIAILGSPCRKARTPEEKKEAKDKKVFQAFRQPFSALIALGFQIPATIGIARAFDYLAYKRPINAFKDKTLGTLIPDKKYLARQAKKAMKENADPKLVEEWKEELEKFKDNEKVKEAFKKSIKEEYDIVGRKISDEKLEQIASNPKKLEKYKAKEMASAKHKSLFDAKIAELDINKFDIKDYDLVTKDYLERAKDTFKDEFKALEKNSLNAFDKFVKIMGFSNKNVSKYNKAEKDLAKQKGLELLQKDKPGILDDKAKKFEQFIKHIDEESSKVYKNKKFWIQLVTNLVMVAISCTVLNWMHPKFMDFWEGVKQAKKEDEERKAARANAVNNKSENPFDGSYNTKKVEVRA